MHTIAGAQLKEYELLREEILHSDRLIVQVFSIAVSAAAVIVAQALVSENQYANYAFLVPVPVFWIIGSYVADKRWVIWTIASYIRHFVEDTGVGPQWETRLSDLRRHQNRMDRKFAPGQNIIMIEMIMFILLPTVCVSLFVLFAVLDSGFCPVRLAVLISGILIAVTVGLVLGQYLPLMREGKKRDLDTAWDLESHAKTLAKA